MIKINNVGSIEIKDLDIAYFKIKMKEISYEKNIVELDLDPTDYLPGGSKSSGLFVPDMCSFAISNFNNLMSVCNKSITISDLKSITDVNSFSGNFPKFAFDDVECSPNFSKHIVGKLYDSTLFAYTFFPLTLQPGIYWDSSCNKYDLLESPVFQAHDFLDLLYKIYIYTYSQKSRDEMTANSYMRLGFECSMYGGENPNVYNRYINDYIEYNDITYFVAKNVYNLSRSNNSNASGCHEVLSVKDYALLIDLYKPKDSIVKILDINHDLNIVTINSSKINDNDGLLLQDSVFSISGYKAVKNDCLVSANIKAYYNKLPEDINHALVRLFYQTCGYSTLNYRIAKLIDSVAISLKHDDIVFDMPIDKLIENDNIGLDLTYTAYTKSGGARKYDYKTLYHKKISPVSRRDCLYDVCHNLMDVMNIDKTKMFKKLDVDFKRFYGYVEN